MHLRELVNAPKIMERVKEEVVETNRPRLGLDGHCLGLKMWKEPTAVVDESHRHLM